MIKKLVLTIALLWSGVALAQWQVPANTVPIGRGPGVVGFNSAANTGTGNLCFLNTLPPSFGPCATSQAVRIVTTAGAVTVVPADGIVEINKTTPATTAVILPTSPLTGSIYTIKDGAGNAFNFNITISPPTGTIDGAATYILNTAFAAVGFYFDGTTWKVI